MMAAQRAPAAVQRRAGRDVEVVQTTGSGPTTMHACQFRGQSVAVMLSALGGSCEPSATEAVAARARSP